MRESDLFYLKRAVEISGESRKHGNTPFGALLTDEDGNILLEQENIEISTGKCTGHAETSLAELASVLYDKAFLSKCTLYTSAEPCVMCSGAIYWANIGTIVYAMSEERLLSLTGSNAQNPTFSLSCRDVLASGQKSIEIRGPFPELEEDAVSVHLGYWK
jgi:tRNA(Arg) A34 adenosine deaminase TadA